MIVDFESGRLVVEYCRLVLSGKLILCIAEYRGGYLKRREVFPTAPSPTITSLRPIV